MNKLCVKTGTNERTQSEKDDNNCTNSDKRSTRTTRNGATVKRENHEKLTLDGNNQQNVAMENEKFTLDGKKQQKVTMENEKLTLDGNKQQNVAIL